MATLSYADQALQDLERLTDFLLDTAPSAAHDTVDLIIEAVSILQHHPLIGRTVDPDLRELVISRGNTGYVALYSYEYPTDAILILTIRHQREAGYPAA
ncbi:type II toxin-antitoxin system RelE/ParE family toxin [Castellaniella sp.]|uniref:type II toxin-antitoxin system RelE/ParE family toxin n=1 Tax=Castellaniella sp. TaxID=1955812 RepID=UPI003C70854A